jgi:hypothetical protein
MRVALALGVGALLLPPVAVAAKPPPLGSVAQPPRLTEQRATRIFREHDKVADWLARYPPKPVTRATLERVARRWKVEVWSGQAGQVALGRVDDETGAVTEAWTGPQVAWKMARGYEGAFGGKRINSAWLWLSFCAAFLLGLADLRRPLSMRNLDLLVLLSFSVSLWFFNRGDIFTSAPLAYPPLLYLLGRAIWIGFGRGTVRASRPVWPVWILAAATLFLAGFRVGLNVQSSNVIDVGYSGVIGADRIVHGQAPYGHMPVQDDLKPCGEADAEGVVRERVQTNGRCESANERGDTYGPVNYLAYAPGYLLLGWSHKWDELPAAHFTAILFDLLCLAGLALVGLRFGGTRLAATLAFAWTAYPFTQYASNSNTNDALMPAFLIWGFLFVTSDWWRGVFLALAAWTKFAALLLAPLWLSYPEALPRPRARNLFIGGFAVATAAAFSILLLEPDPLHAARVFWDRTLGWQLGRESPFSIWGWGQYHAAGIPDLGVIQTVLEVIVIVGSLALAVVPRRRSPLQFAALTAAVLIGFELVLTHWSYLYLPWLFPFAALTALAPRKAARETERAVEGERTVVAVAG